MTHRCIARIAGAAILGAGLLLGGASPALATETGPDSEACQTATEERDFRQDRVDQRQRQADNFEAKAQQHDANAAAADERASNKQAAADQADDRATRRQAAADEADQRASNKQAAAAEAEANSNLERRDQYREEAEQALANRDQYRAEAAASRENRDRLRGEAADARAERDEERKAAAADRDTRDTRLEQRDRQIEKRDAVDLSVCDEQPDNGKQPDNGDKTPPKDGPGFVDKDCADFASQDEAQALLDEDRSDPHRLDADNDGRACEQGGQEHTTCSNVGVIDDSGNWVWDCEQWVQVSADTDDGSAPKGGVETGDGGTGKLAYTGAGNALGWLAGGLGLVGAGVLALALVRTRPVLRRN